VCGVYRLIGRAPKSYSYDTDGLRLIYKAVGSEQKVYMEPSSNGTAISAGNGRRQNNLVGCLMLNGECESDWFHVEPSIVV